MLNLICPQRCPSAFCEVVCPASAIANRDKNVYLDTDKCNRCGICRVMCMTLSRDKTLQRSRPWLSSKLAKPRAR